MPTSSRLTTNLGNGPLRPSTATVTLTAEDGASRTVLVGTIRQLDRDSDGGTWITLIDHSQVRVREEPDEVLRRVDEADGLPGVMSTHNHGRAMLQHRLGWKD